MKEKLKKILCVALSVMMILSFAACGSDSETADTDAKTEDVADSGDKESKDEDEKSDDDKKSDDKKDKKESKDDDAEAAEETVVGFMDAFCEFNLATAAKYVEGGEENAESMPFENIDDLMDLLMVEVASDPTMEPYADEMKGLLENMFDKVSGSMEYNIDGVEKDGDDYVVDVTFESINLSTATELFNNMDGEAFGEEAATEALNELMADGTITENSTEQEVMDALMPVMFDRMEEFILAELDGLATEKVNAKFVVVEDGGKWLISDDSDVDDLTALLGA